MSISRINFDGANTTTVLSLGVLTKLRLEIQVASDLKPKNFTLEVCVQINLFLNYVTYPFSPRLTQDV